MKQFIAFALIQQKGIPNSEMEDDTEVSSKETAEQEWKALVNKFNRTLRRGEKPREFVKLLKVEEKEIPEEEEENDY